MTEELKTKEAESICKKCLKKHEKEGKICYYLSSDGLEEYGKEYCSRIEDIDLLIEKLLKE